MDRLNESIAVWTMKGRKLMMGALFYRRYLAIPCLLWLFAGCSQGEAPAPVDAGNNVVIPSPMSSPTALPEPTPAAATEPTVQAIIPPTEVIAEPSPVPAPTAEPEVAKSVFYNLPATTLLYATGLYASPNSNKLASPVELPSGEIVYVLGRNTMNSHLRVVWNTGVGWIATSFTEYNGQTEQLRTLPEFTRVPPPCADPITTQFNLNSTWISDGRRRVAVIIDVFRSEYGEFPASYLSLTVNGSVIGSSRREVVENGQFSLKDVVFSLPGYLQQGDQLGYQLETTSTEPLTFMSTIFSIPEDCQWEGITR
jgi:hypothetical protein